MSAKEYTTTEAVELLKQGKKIASTFWTNLPDLYIVLATDGSGAVITSNGNPYSSSIHMFAGWYPNAKWVEYEENKTYTCAEALELMKQGKKVRINSWEPRSLHIYINGSVIVNDRGCTEFNTMGEFLDCYSNSLFYWIEFVESGSTKSTSIEPITEKPQPCSRCGFPDHWNSKGKDGKWYCYKHCSF